MKLTIIGNGNMAKALIGGLCQQYDIEVVGRNEDKLNNLKKDFNNISVTLVGDKYDITGKNIIFCVKPYALEEVACKLQGEAQSLFSILAGTKLSSLKSVIKSQNYVRVMPNIGAVYNKSMTTLTGDELLKNLSIEIFSSIGEVLWLKSENELDIATAIAGSGPAYLALIAEAMADGGVKCGLSRADSKKLVQGLFEGFSPLINNYEPSHIKDQVMSPSGTTAVGVATLEEGSIRSSFIKAIESAYKRAVELGKK
ncbi:pyrroline-5-carboxylate reductase [Arcobacter sp. FWKO B]|uniref:pyrroline-5-carboxylate reductase n=1 Tax=Arcobacter sp. FWKO B TaxID=2593672 RepID=UPI0018A5A138|nr:pyrroline-5-carboxylate reductase [Arcobacter sp. FWKO B]QOG12887.1 pyrroline-5-carboxylate reductase [Arcobacter sp. FWKO B]